MDPCPASAFCGNISWWYDGSAISSTYYTRGDSKWEPTPVQLLQSVDVNISVRSRITFRQSLASTILPTLLSSAKAHIVVAKVYQRQDDRGRMPIQPGHWPASFAVAGPCGKEQCCHDQERSDIDSVSLYGNLLQVELGINHRESILPGSVPQSQMGIGQSRSPLVLLRRTGERSIPRTDFLRHQNLVYALLYIAWFLVVRSATRGPSQCYIGIQILIWFQKHTPSCKVSESNLITERQCAASYPHAHGLFRVKIT